MPADLVRRAADGRFHRRQELDPLQNDGRQDVRR